MGTPLCLNGTFNVPSTFNENDYLNSQTFPWYPESGHPAQNISQLVSSKSRAKMVTSRQV